MIKYKQCVYYINEAYGRKLAIENGANVNG